MWIVAVVTSLLLLGLRLDVARGLGLSDAEALYFAYGFHPQPVYLDHPGLIGWLARCLESSASAFVIHVWTALFASLFISVLRLRPGLAGGRSLRETARRPPLIG